MINLKYKVSLVNERMFLQDIPYLRPIMRLVEEERREKEEWEES